eukprot:COSAG02_NODE_32273_length_519_cov_0.685714_1_plen_133_part_10
MLETSQKFTDFMLATFVPQLQKQIKSVTIPNQKGKASGFDYSVSSMTIKTVDLSKAKITFKQSQGLAISVPLNIEGTLQERGAWHPVLLAACLCTLSPSHPDDILGASSSISGRQVVLQVALYPSHPERQWVI